MLDLVAFYTKFLNFNFTYKIINCDAYENERK